MISVVVSSKLAIPYMLVSIKRQMASLAERMQIVWGNVVLVTVWPVGNC
jgi:hypothetical protein